MLRVKALSSSTSLLLFLDDNLQFTIIDVVLMGPRISLLWNCHSL